MTCVDCVKQLCGRIVVVAREGPGLSGVLVAGYAKIRYHSGSHSSTHIGIC